MSSGIITLIIIAICIVYLASIYNKLVALKNHYKNGFAQIEVQLKRRYDLIPNLLETAKAYLEHERETLEAVVKARNTAISGLANAAKDPGAAGALHSLASAENMLSGALSKLNVVVENYPDLKADENMRAFSEELTTTENKVAFARQAFNDFVMEYNSYRQSFPPVFFASFFGHSRDAELLEFDDSEKIQDAPKVQF